MLRENVLRKDDDFQSVYKRGRSVVKRYIVVFYKKNKLGYNRTAFLASKKVGNAVKRNRARRLMKESFRSLDCRFIEGFDLIFVARKSICDVKCRDVYISMKNAAEKAKLLEKKR